ncbi:MAG: hypothetical protein ABI036_20800 [Fibrobacteria bacterium]
MTCNCMLVAYCGVVMVTVLYAGAIALQAMFGLDPAYGVWIVGLRSGLYTAFGGLKAVAYSDLLHGGASSSPSAPWPPRPWPRASWASCSRPCRRSSSLSS